MELNNDNTSAPTIAVRMTRWAFALMAASILLSSSSTILTWLGFTADAEPIFVTAGFICAALGPLLPPLAAALLVGAIVIRHLDRREQSWG